MSPINHLKQFGDIENYARYTLKMSRAGKKETKYWDFRITKTKYICLCESTK